MTDPAFPAATILGYPRIGRHRELKKALESYWAGRTSLAELESAAAALRAATRERLAWLGLGRRDASIPSSFSFYDHVLDAAVLAGAVPERFTDLVSADGTVGLDAVFAIARGTENRPPLEMTKWFDTNYHYLVPEIGPGTSFRLSSLRTVDEFTEAVASGFVTRPVVVGPVTLLLLSKAAADAPRGFRPLSRIEDLVPVYADLLARLASAGAPWVQLDEPGLVTENLDDERSAVLAAVRLAYGRLAAGSRRPRLFVPTSYGSAGEALGVLAEAGVDALGLDLVSGTVPDEARTREALAGTTLVGGVVNGRNVWRGDLEAALRVVEGLRDLSPSVAVSTSTSLLHVPHDLDEEPDLPAALVEWLAFADQKVRQAVTLGRALTEGRAAIADELDAATEALHRRRSAPGVRDDRVRDRMRRLGPSDLTRGSVAARRSAQERVLGLPILPMTTIGSFPQVAGIRRARAELRAGTLSEDAYRERMRAEIRRVIDLQHDIGVDVAVHGEPERNDMVQYFAEHLDGFAATANGWVQSYGSRCTRPAILWGDVSRPRPITVEWSRYAQSLTRTPVKGMLTGPVTILAWSFVRDDQPRADTARQLALALRDEVADLEASGIRIVQVDEPALRELLPLTVAEQAAYLEWSVDAFRLATSGAADETQIHTHLCYSEFGAVIDAIRNLNADVTSIEAARSRMEVVADIAASGFETGIGPGVYDIHSPRVPSVAEITGLIETALQAVPPARLWINPDCGLKTRGYDEVTAALRNMREASLAVRDRLSG